MCACLLTLTLLSFCLCQWKGHSCPRGRQRSAFLLWLPALMQMSLADRRTDGHTDRQADGQSVVGPVSTWWSSVACRNMLYRPDSTSCYTVSLLGSDGSCGSVPVRDQNLFAADGGRRGGGGSLLPRLSALQRTTEPTVVYQAVTRGFKTRMLSV